MTNLFLFVTAFTLGGGRAHGFETNIKWTSPVTGKTWSAHASPGRGSLLDMKAKCQSLGLTLPDTNSAEMDKDLFEFLTHSVKVDAPEFPHFTFRKVPVRFFPLTNAYRKEDRYRSSQKQDGELSGYFSSTLAFCDKLGNASCVANSRKWLQHLEQKMKVRTQNFRQIGFHIVFVDALGHEANLEVLEQEYEKFYVQKKSYETARTLIVAHEEPRDWSGLLCVTP